MSSPNGQSRFLQREAAPIDFDRIRERMDGEVRRQAERLLAVAFGEDDAARRESADAPPGEELAALLRAVAEVHAEIAKTAVEHDASEMELLRERVTRASERLAGQAVERRVRPWREMLRDVTHDIRSPLNSILFLTEGLYNEHSGPLETAQREQIGIVYSAAASLLNLVNDLLDFARVDEGQVRTSEVDFSLPAVVGEIRRLMEPLVDHYGADFEVEVAVEGRRRGDPQLLTRIAVNLLSNAVEAGERGGEVRLRVENDDPAPASPTDGDVGSKGLRVVVEDRGPGADPERLRPLLERRPDDDVTRVLQGRTRGLGLVICGRLVRAAGGRISVEQRERGGTRFVALLPFPPVS